MTAWAKMPPDCPHNNSMNATSRSFTPDDKASLMKALTEKLVSGSKPGFEIRVGSKNTFELALRLENGKNRAIGIVNEKSVSHWGSWTKPIPVKELSDAALEMYPDFLLRPGFVTAEELEEKYAIREQFSLSAAFDALARRVNSRGAVLSIREFVQGQGWVVKSSFRCGSSFEEAVVRISL